jgi:hypothetical protein
MLELVMALIALVAAAWRGCGRLLQAAGDSVARAWFGGVDVQAWEGGGFPGGGPPGRLLAGTALAQAALARPAPAGRHVRLDGWSGLHYPLR